MKSAVAPKAPTGPYVTRVGVLGTSPTPSAATGAAAPFGSSSGGRWVCASTVLAVPGCPSRTYAICAVSPGLSVRSVVSRSP